MLLAAMFVRAQEYYECPSQHIRRHPFSLEDYKAWVRETEPGVGFTYYSKWPGFNVPGWVLEALRSKEIGELRVEEKALLALAPAGTKYVIGVCGEDQHTSLQHELAVRI